MCLSRFLSCLFSPFLKLYLVWERPKISLPVATTHHRELATLSPPSQVVSQNFVNGSFIPFC
jgi:hypothetical protein